MKPDLRSFFESRGIRPSVGPEIFENANRHLTCDSREVRPGSVFVAIRGQSSDGHRFIPGVLENAALVFVEDVYLSSPEFGEIPKNLQNKIVSINDTLAFSRDFAPVFYDFPSRKMRVVGVTGTNGKTTSTYLLEALYAGQGKKTGVIGTIEIRYAGKNGIKTIPSINTTPDAVSLQTILFEMLSEGVEVVAMEVSSHALELGRLNGIDLDSLLFTNITPDHLDFHQTMDRYLDAKLKGFELLAKSVKPKKKAVVWRKIDRAEKIFPFIQALENKSYSLRTYGLEKADLEFHPSKIEMSGSTGKVLLGGKDLGECRLSLVGEFNILNAMACLSEWLDASGSEKEISLQLQAGFVAMNAIKVPGRLEAIPTPKGGFVYVDYAHTPDALENILKTLKKLPQKRLLCVFGCGGDRDRTKRPVMGRIAGELCDVVIVTSDNPRTEEPLSILKMIEEGIRPV
ncbi:MAG: UDP-N-acetylmuramoyl-L-alanyl-D-glutamate--2,6-diaminopimelate ligase, partial [Spirochaetia bacterium]|nr:UDP-N-acetylmuramoyl-L-alanyl-D-glutamate--2,6-diaminopimelate ligase [Spirochaetia bacterium]